MAEQTQHSRRVVATMYRGQSKEVILSRRYRYFDTAMPRMVQLALNGYANEGDFVIFHSEDYGVEIGTLRVNRGNKFDLTMSELVKASPHLLKLMNEMETL